jgi:hypothetical protein
MSCDVIENVNDVFPSDFFFLFFEERIDEIEADEGGMLIDIFVEVEFFLNFFKATEIEHF